jgi:3-isopropylmalate/(R)-2-methylmalate dehydratase small subunit
MHFVNFTATGVALNHANIDTDQILPKQFLSGISREGFGQHLFHDSRYLDHEGHIKNPDFVLNKSAYQGAKILVTGENFGCGSSREHAPWALAGFGFDVIIATSFADIFYTNCINNQLLPIALNAGAIDQLSQQITLDPATLIEINLAHKWVKQGSHQYDFDLSDEHQHSLLYGIDPIQQTLLQEQLIVTHEQGRPSWTDIHYP